MLTSLAVVAENNNYVCPEIDDGDVIDIKGGRHPVIEKMIDDVNCRNCKNCAGKNCEVWLIWFRRKWQGITTWYKGKKVEDLQKRSDKQ